MTQCAGVTERTARTRWVGVLLAVLGLAQMAGDLLGVPALRGLAAATAASPAPRVFSAVQGLETFSTRFFVEWRDTRGDAHSFRLDPEAYAALRGPYNRRNVYGAVLAFGPVLRSNETTRPLFEAVARYALCGQRPILRELGIDADRIASGVRVRLEPSTAVDLPLVLEAPCP